MGTYTREIQIAGYNRWYCGYISVDAVNTVNDTTSRITVTAALEDKYAAQYGTHYDVIVNGTTYRSRDVLLNNYGNWATRDAVTFTVDVGRGASGWNCAVQIHVYGKTYNNYYGSAGGDAWATEYAWIPQRGYSQPHPPRNPKLARVSDTSHKITWDVDYTGMDGAYPWAGVYVDRRTDDGSWVNIADVSWDVTNYTDNSTKPGHKYEYRLCAHGPGGNSTHVSCGTSYTTPSAPSRVEAVKASATEVTLRVYGAWAYANAWEVQRSTDGGSTWAAITASTEGEDPAWLDLHDKAAPAGTVVYRVRAKRGSLASAWVKSNSVTTITPPLAPKVTADSVVPTGTAVTVSWVPNHQDGSAQSAAQLELVGGETITKSFTTAKSASVTLAKGSWKVRVRTKGLHADWGAWSGYVAITVADYPQCWVASPATDGMLVDAVPLTVQVAATDETGIAQATLALAEVGGAAIATADVTNLKPVSFGSYATIRNGIDYLLTLTVKGGSGLSKTATRRFKTHWAGPAIPEVSLSYDDALACHVKVRNALSSYEVEQTTLVGPMTVDEVSNELSMLGTITVDGNALVLGSASRCSSFTVERVSYGGDAVIASGVLDSQETIDRIPPLNTDYEYKVTGYADNGTSSQVATGANVFAHGMALNFGQDASVALVLDYNGDYSTSSKRSVETYHFADGGENGDLPMSYMLDELDKKTSLSWEMKRDDHDKYMRVMDEQCKGWWRGHAGERAYGPMEFDMSVKSAGIWKGSASITHNVFEEPING